MTRSTLFSLGLVTVIALTGCSTAEAQRYPTPRRGGVDYRSVDYRSNRYDVRYTREWRQVERDVRQYVRELDRELRLSDRQEWRITEILENRTYKLLSESRTRRTDQIYPFPRRMRHNRYANRTVQSFWYDADGRVERILDRRQTSEYRYLTGRASRSRYDDGHRERDYDRYDDRRDDRRRDDDRRDDRDRGRN